MQKEQRLQEDRRSSRRTILDAIAVLREYANFKERDRATIRLAPMRLPSHDIVTAVDLVFLPVSGGAQYSVALPTCKHFTGQPEGSQGREKFDISRLDEGVAGFAGTVTLRDGLDLRWVEVVPTRRVLFPNGASFLPVLEAELLAFPQSKTTDQIDGISQALAHKISGYDSSMSWV